MAELSDPDIRASLSEAPDAGTVGWTAQDGRALARDPGAVLGVDLEEPPSAFGQVLGPVTPSEVPGELRRTAATSDTAA